MESLILHIIAHPRDLIATLSMAAVIFLLNAMYQDQKKRLERMEDCIKTHTEELKKLQLMLVKLEHRESTVQDIEADLSRIKKRVMRIEEVVSGF